MPTTFDVKSFDAVRDLERYFNSKEWRRIVRPCFVLRDLFVPMWSSADKSVGGLKESGFVEVTENSICGGKKKTRAVALKQAILYSADQTVWLTPIKPGIAESVRNGVLTVLSDDEKRKVMEHRAQMTNAGSRRPNQVFAQASL
jgi:hypothetical protein